MGGRGPNSAVPDPDQRGPLGDGVLKVAAHSHGQAIDITLIIGHFASYVNKKLIHFCKKRPIGTGEGADRRDGHQTPQAHMGQGLSQLSQGTELDRVHPALALLHADIYLQQDVLNQAQLVRLGLHSLEQVLRPHRLDQVHPSHHLLDLVGLEVAPIKWTRAPS